VRISPRIVLSMLLVLPAIALLLTPSVSSQSYTTITSWTTETSQVTSSTYSTFAVATTTLTSTVTNTYNYSFTIPALSARACHYNYIAFANLTAGDRLVGQVVTSSVMDFYVMSSAQFQGFHGPCNKQYPALVTANNVVSSYSLDWVVPADGTYYFVFFNYASWGQGTNQVVGSFSLEFLVPVSYPYSRYTTMTHLITFAITETAGSMYSSTVQTSPWSSLPMTYIEYLVVIVVLGAIAVGAILLSGKRARKPAAAKARGKVKAKKEVQFCINCGAELPRDSKFCNRCGSAQS
jgi:hypothetical protein